MTEYMLNERICRDIREIVSLTSQGKCFRGCLEVLGDRFHDHGGINASG